MRLDCVCSEFGKAKQLGRFIFQLEEPDRLAIARRHWDSKTKVTGPSLSVYRSVMPWIIQGQTHRETEIWKQRPGFVIHCRCCWFCMHYGWSKTRLVLCVSPCGVCLVCSCDGDGKLESMRWTECKGLGVWRMTTGWNLQTSLFFVRVRARARARAREVKKVGGVYKFYG